MGTKRRKGVGMHLLGLIVACGVCGGALAFAAGFGVDSFSQVAVGAASDAMCMGGADAKCPCGKGLKNGKCDPKTKGNGKIDCPCKDITSGDEAASGKCAAVGKCKADKADGKPPELPKLPEGKPKEDKQQPCQPKTATSTGATSATTTNATTTDKRVQPDATGSGGASDPNCPENFSGGSGGFGAQAGGGFWGSMWDSVNPFSSPDDPAKEETSKETGNGGKSGSAWGNLMKSLGISNDSDTEDTDTTTQTKTTSTSTGTVSSKTGATGIARTVETEDFIKTGTTFTYQAGVGDFNQEAASVLDQIAKTLKKLLEIVSKWF